MDLVLGDENDCVVDVDTILAVVDYIVLDDIDPALAAWDLNIITIYFLATRFLITAGPFYTVENCGFFAFLATEPHQYPVCLGVLDSESFNSCAA